MVAVLLRPQCALPVIVASLALASGSCRSREPRSPSWWIDVEAFAGIYSIEEIRSSDESCDHLVREAKMNEAFLVAHRDSLGFAGTLEIDSCASREDCRAKASMKPGDSQAFERAYAVCGGGECEDLARLLWEAGYASASPSWVRRCKEDGEGTVSGKTILKFAADEEQWTQVAVIGEWLLIESKTQLCPGSGLSCDCVGREVIRARRVEVLPPKSPRAGRSERR